MSDVITVQGVVLSAMSVGEYDRRLVILTRERGKISAFAKGARRQNSPLVAASGPFVFGSFTLYEGRSSYTVQSAEILYHFAELAFLQPEVYYGYYFLEAADYFGKEGIDGTDTMNLLYVTVKALLGRRMEARLVKALFELRLLTIQGLMPQVFACAVSGRSFGDEEDAFFSLRHHGLIGREQKAAGDSFRVSHGTVRLLQLAVSVPLQKLYQIRAEEEYISEICPVASAYFQSNTDKVFRSLKILKIMDP